MFDGRDGIAIIGMACLFPGASDAASYWWNIVSKTDCVSDPPEEWGGRAAAAWATRLAADASFDPEADGFIRVAEVIDAIYAR